MKLGVHGAHYNYRKCQGLKMVACAAQIQGKHVSQLQELTLHRELKKCHTTIWQRLRKRASTYSWCLATNSNVPAIQEMCLCVNMLVLPLTFLPIRSLCDSSLEWHVQYRCHQVMTTTLDYPQWRLCWMSVTTKVLAAQTLLHGRHSVGGGCHSNSSSHVCAIWSCLSSSSSRWSSCMETGLDALRAKEQHQIWIEIMTKGIKIQLLKDPKKL